MIKKNKFLRRLFQVHSFTGLLTGIFLLLLGLSGSALVFMQEIDHYTNRELFAVEVRDTQIGVDRIYKIITERYPRLSGIGWLNPEASANEAHDFRLYLNDGNLYTYDLGVITIDPYTGEILREGRYDQWQAGMMQWIFQFHFSFHFGMPGTALTAIFGITMLISMLTGLAIYRKHIWKVLTFRSGIKWKNKRMAFSGVHRVLGVWSLIFNLIIFFTGFWMNLFAFDKQVWESKKSVNTLNMQVEQSFDTLYARALEIMPNLTKKYVYFPTQPGRSFSIRGSLPGNSCLYGNSNAVHIDVQSGNTEKVVLAEHMSAKDKLRAMVLPLHAGTYGGLVLRWFYVVLGLTPGVLCITGFLLWIRRKKIM
ncbi:PepSY domain-containing protein [Olivibacter sp. SDN3]|nr:PepSY domain-containing protein [Olivibacter sp. SDN3]